MKTPCPTTLKVVMSPLLDQLVSGFPVMTNYVAGIHSMIRPWEAA